jgi:hypothetical protein
LKQKNGQDAILTQIALRGHRPFKCSPLLRNFWFAREKRQKRENRTEIKFSGDYVLGFLSIAVALRPTDICETGIGFSQILNQSNLPIRFSADSAKALILHNLSVR